MSFSYTFPKVLDNTMVSTYRSCPTKFWWRHQRMLQRGETSIHLISGGAFAKGLEVTRKAYFDDNTPFDIALAKGAAALFKEYGFVEPHPKYAAKAVSNMIGALAYYFETWPINSIMLPYLPTANARHAIEWNFSTPIPNVSHPDTGAPLLYCGRFDMVGKHQSGMLLGEDDKTTSQLGDSWFNRWKLSSQILGYCWGARQHDINLAGFCVRGVSLLKNNYGHAEGLVLVNEWQLDRFVENLQATAERMIASYVADKAFPQGNRIRCIPILPAYELDMGGTCSAYGGCDYLPLCESPEPESWIDANYVEREWNPLASRD